MNKNALIGLLAVVVILGGAYLLVKNNPVPPTVVVNQLPTDTGYQAPNPTRTEPGLSTPSAPSVQTGSGSTTSNSTAAVTGSVVPNGDTTTYWYDYGETTAFGFQNDKQSIGSGYTPIATPAYITGLKANALYYFRLNANNRFATVNGATYSFQTNSNPPPVGSIPIVHTTSASNISRTTADLNGQLNPNGSTTTYWFEYGKTTSLGNVKTLQTQDSGTTLVSVSLSLSGLDPLTQYYFRLNAQNQYGTTIGTTLSFMTGGPANPKQPSVTTTSATNITTSGAHLTGRINPNGAETTYWFEYSSDSLLGTLIGNGTSPLTVGVGNNTTNVESAITGLKNNTKYFYHLVGRNAAGTVYGNIISFTTKR
jgi:phosphodiesterase/alkaline phosphatase D-like protein